MAASKIDRQSEILDHGRAALAEDGIATFSLRRVADRAGLRLSSVQYYFATLDAFLLALVDRTLAEYDAAFEAIEERHGPDPATLLEAVLDHLLGQSADAQAQAFFFQLWAAAGHKPALAERLDRSYGRYAARLEALLAELPETTKAQAPIRARVLLGLTEGAMLFLKNGNAKHMKAFSKEAKTLLRMWSGG